MSLNYKVQQGDTLDKVAQKYGFSNAQKAGAIVRGSNTQANLDKVGVGEDVTFTGIPDGSVPTITKAPVIATSSDLKGQFENNSSTLNDMNSALAKTVGTGTQNTNAQNTPQEKTSDANANANANQNPNLNPDGTQKEPVPADQQTYADDPIYKQITTENKKAVDDFNLNAEESKKEYSTLFNNTLSNNDATYKAIELRANATFQQRSLIEQRIFARAQALNRLNNGGDISNSANSGGISENERQLGDQIYELSTARDATIAEAQVAKNSGDALALKTKIDSIRNIETSMRDNMSKVADEGYKKYKLLRDIEKDQIAKTQEVKTKSLNDKVGSNWEAYKNAKTSQDKSKIINKIVADSAGHLNYSDVESAFNKQETSNLNLEKERGAIDLNKANIDLKEAQANKANKPTGKGGTKGTAPGKETIKNTLPDGTVVTSYNNPIGTAEKNAKAKASAVPTDPSKAKGVIDDVVNFFKGNKSTNSQAQTSKKGFTYTVK